MTIDWTVRENVRAQLRVLVKRILRKYGYPPDKQEKATQTVLEQAEVLSEGWAVATRLESHSEPTFTHLALARGSGVRRSRRAISLWLFWTGSDARASAASCQLADRSIVRSSRSF